VVEEEKEKEEKEKEKEKKEDGITCLGLKRDEASRVEISDELRIGLNKDEGEGGTSQCRHYNLIRLDPRKSDVSTT